jgi:carboxyl-terminal processing protease
LLQSAKEVSDLFLDSGHLIVSTRGRDGKRLQEIYAQDNENYAKNYPLVVLINGGSASASEIVAGAIQDWDRGLVLGTNSFGKGSVQSIFPVADSEALKLTTAKYYTPSGRCIHKSENNKRHGDEEELADGIELDTSGEFPSDPENLPLYETLKLQREVRGGGGIMPDIILQQEEISDTALDLERQSAFFKFSVEIVANSEINEDFTVADALLSSFQEHLVVNEIEVADSAYAANEDYIRMAIRREVLYKKFGGSAAYRSTLEMDRVLQETLKLMNESTSLETLFAKSVDLEKEEFKH